MLNSKNFLVVSILIFFVAFGTPYYSNAEEPQDQPVKTESSGLRQKIKEKIPVIKQQYEKTLAQLEKFRIEKAKFFETEKQKVRTELTEIHKQIEDTSAPMSGNALTEPLKQIELFFFTFLFSLFNIKLLFYVFLATVVFLFLRALFSRVF